jgi:glycosyltransferase involved in cell wall biosynthesis
MNGLKDGISVVVPCYNSSGTLKELTERLTSVMESLGSLYEIIFINDASTDETWKIIEEIVSKSNKVSAVNLMRNYGQHNSLLCGIRRARYARIITLDDDLQHPPEEIQKLIGAFNDNVDVIYGSANYQVHNLPNRK